MTGRLDPTVAAALRRGQVIPAHPLALTEARQLDERRQRALTRYYLAAGAGQPGLSSAGLLLLSFLARAKKFRNRYLKGIPIGGMVTGRGYGYRVRPGNYPGLYFRPAWS